MIGKLLAALALCAGLFLASPGPATAAPFGLAAAVPSAAQGLAEAVRYRRHWRHGHYRYRRHWHRHAHWRRHHGHRSHAARARRDPLVFHAGRGTQTRPSQPKTAAPKLY